MFFKSKKEEVKQDCAPQLTPASSGEEMRMFANWIKTFSSLVPKNVFEIGANMGQDAEVLREEFGLQAKDVWTFEPHPSLDHYIRSSYDFNQHPFAVSDKDGEVEVNFIDTEKNSNTGISSMREHLTVSESDFFKKVVPAVRLDTFIKSNKIKTIDFMKLDIEGCNYEALVGLGDKISLVKSIHIEAEHEESWRDEKLWIDIKTLLEPHFEMVYFQRYFTQSDSFWIKREYLRGEPLDEEKA